VVQVARKVAGSGSERARPCLQVARLCLPVRGVGGKHGWVRGRLADRSCCSLFSLAQCILVARGCVGGPGRAQFAGSGSERARRCWQVARMCLPVRGVGASTVGCTGGRRLVLLLSVLTGPVHVMVARGCAGGPGRAQSCWKLIRARASLLASSGQVWPVRGVGGNHGWVRGRSKSRARCGESGKHDGVRARLAHWSCCSPLSLAQRIMVARGCAGGPGCAQSCLKWIRARVVAGK
jgi:hypothetical protein